MSQDHPSPMGFVAGDYFMQSLSNEFLCLGSQRDFTSESIKWLPLWCFLFFFLPLNVFVAAPLFLSRMDARYPQCLHCKVIPLKNSWGKFKRFFFFFFERFSVSFCVYVSYLKEGKGRGGAGKKKKCFIWKESHQLRTDRSRCHLLNGLAQSKGKRT